MKKGTLILIGVFAVLLVIVLATRERQVSVGIVKFELPPIEKDKVVAIEIAGPKAASLEKEGAGWTVADPAKPDQKHPADEQQINSALDAYKETKVHDLVSDKSERQTEFEIDDAKALKVRITSQGAPSVELLLGKPTRSGGVYIRQAKSNAIFTAEGRFPWMAKRDVSAWRKRSIIGAKLEDVLEVAVHPKDQESYVLTNSGDGGGWKLKEGTKLPDRFRYDASAGQGLVQQLVNLRAQDFIDSPGSDESLGFAGPHSFVEAKLKDGKQVRVHLGQEQESKETKSKAVAVRLEGDPQVYLVPPYTANILQKRAADLRDLSLLSFEAQKVSKLSVVSAGKKTVVAREGDTWKVLEPKKLPSGFEFDPARITAELNMLRGLKASRLIDGKVEPAQSGLSKPTTQVDLTLEGGAHQSLTFGKEAKSDKGKEVYVKGSADALTYAISDGQRSRFDSGVEMFKKLPPPPPNMAGGGMRGLESLPPDVRAKIEAQLRQQPHQ
ncbi:MAG TPA: DUF4340 domain-containing protein [Myxococcales bacterium]